MRGSSRFCAGAICTRVIRTGAVPSVPTVYNSILSNCSSLGVAVYGGGSFLLGPASVGCAGVFSIKRNASLEEIAAAPILAIEARFLGVCNLER